MATTGCQVALLALLTRRSNQRWRPLPLAMQGPAAVALQRATDAQCAVGADALLALSLQRRCLAKADRSTLLLPVPTPDNKHRAVWLGGNGVDKTRALIKVVGAAGCRLLRVRRLSGGSAVLLRGAKPWRASPDCARNQLSGTWPLRLLRLAFCRLGPCAHHMLRVFGSIRIIISIISINITIIHIIIATHRTQLS